MKRPILLVNLGLAALVTGSLVYAAVDTGPRSTLMSTGAYEAAQKQIDRESRASRLRCASLPGYESSVCEAESKADRKVRLADLDARYLGTVTANQEARSIRVEAQYLVEYARCRAFEGQERSTCETISTQARAASLQALGTQPA